MKVGQLIVIKSKLMQQGHVQVSDGMSHFSGFGPDLISGPNDRPFFDSTSGH